MPDAIHNSIAILLKGSSLTENEMHAAVLQVMDGNAPSVGLGMLLTGLKLRGETVDEIVGAARAMRERVTPIKCRRNGLLDTCGTGGDALSTFNISTATALVTAACGVPIAKHSNRSASSVSGSADVLEALDVRVDLASERVAECIDTIGIGFCFAPLVHGAMKFAAPVRKQLGFRTIFNLLGPLTNPAGAEFQLLGAGRVALAEKLAAAVARLGTKRTLVVCGNDELDEVSLWGRTTVFRVQGQSIDVSEWSAERLNLKECCVSDISVQSPLESAERIRLLVAGERGPARDIVLANAAAALVAAGRSEDPGKAVEMAAAAIDSGATGEVLRRLVEFTKK
ncbi:MAG TPA: anthranilate phosphoribosyltransferase [Planctomycetaceae bacterium]|nr:anthranilate phosphoribosyltransferase [Planctomycetaceae bacterium]